jgi:hypothetical protein
MIEVKFYKHLIFLKNVSNSTAPEKDQCGPIGPEWLQRGVLRRRLSLFLGGSSEDEESLM